MHLVKSDPRFYTVDDRANVAAATQLQKLVEPYQNQYNETMNDVIGQAGMTLTKSRPESTLGNWASDVLQKKAEEYGAVKIHGAVQNYGGLRIPEIVKGDIMLGKIYELMPFDNMLVIVACDGPTLMKLFDNMAQGGGWPISYAFKHQIKDQKTVSLLINGEPVDMNKVYNIAMPDYIANGGNDCFFLVDQKRYETGKFIRDLLIEGVEQSKKPIVVKLDGRVSYTL
ncbi:MAG: hypothetical protein HKN16_04185 [Saprospiraceae bacterium]|nr:hypothetical protein [Saprospiraceae bacterium]